MNTGCDRHNPRLPAFSDQRILGVALRIWFGTRVDFASAGSVEKERRRRIRPHMKLIVLNVI